MRPRIVETTIRDGSYEVEFQYTREDLIILAGLLDEAGFSYIEVGHGRGLAGHLRGNRPALDDEQHLRTARDVVKRAKLGAIICFTGRESEAERLVGLACDCGLDFLRLGMSPGMFGKPVPRAVLTLAAKKNLTVSMNFMRSYALPPARLALLAREAVELGADWIYLVDSAGCMTPTETREYVEALREQVSAPIGFHGHNNLSLAVANSLAALEAGASLLDGTLQGLGRATGNAATEILVTLLQQRLGHELEIDHRLVYALGRRHVRRFVTGGFDPTDVLAGGARLHSGMLAGLRANAQAAGLHVDDLLGPVGASAARAGVLESKQVPDEVVAEACGTTAPERRSGAPPRLAAKLSTSAGAPTCGDLAARLQVHALRDRLHTAVVLVQPACSSFAGPTLLRRDDWMFAVVPIAEDVADLLPHLGEATWLRCVFVDDTWPLRAWPAALADRTRRFSAFELLATAVAPETARGSIVLAIDEQRLARSIRLKLPEHSDVRNWSPDATSILPAREESDRHEASGPAPAHILLQGCSGSEFLRRADRVAFESEAAITLLGDVLLQADQLARLEQRGCRVYLPDLAQLLLAWRSTRLELRSLGSERDDRRCLDVSKGGLLFSSDGAVGRLPSTRSDVEATGDVVDFFRRRLEALQN
jgi:4-hydroxy 2-oxovalerate aldolase